MTEWDDKTPSKREILVGKILGWVFAAPSGVFLLRWFFAILKRGRDLGTFGSSWSSCVALLAFIVGEFMIRHPGENYRHRLEREAVRTASVVRCTGRGLQRLAESRAQKNPALEA